MLHADRNADDALPPRRGSGPHHPREPQRRAGRALEAGGWGFPYYGATDSSPGFITSAWRFLSLYPQAEPARSLGASLEPEGRPEATMVTVRESVPRRREWIVGAWTIRAAAASSGTNGCSATKASPTRCGWTAATRLRTGRLRSGRGPRSGVRCAARRRGDARAWIPGPRGRARARRLSAASELRTRADDLRQRFFRDFAVDAERKAASRRSRTRTVHPTAAGAVDVGQVERGPPAGQPPVRHRGSEDPRHARRADRSHLQARHDRSVRFDPNALQALAALQPDRVPQRLDLADGQHGDRARPHPPSRQHEAGGDARRAVQTRWRMHEKADEFYRKAESIMNGILAACADAKLQGFPAPEWIPGDVGMKIPPKEEIEDRRRRPEERSSCCRR